MESQHTSRLGIEPVGCLMAKLAFPSIIAQLINVLYNMVDRIYLGHIPDIGKEALTGVGVAFPIIMIIAAFSAFTGRGGAPLAAIAMGKGDKTRAELFLGNSITYLLIISILLTVGFSIFKVPVLYAFGASDQTIGHATTYIGIYLIGTVFVQLSLGLNNFISAQGFAKTAMWSILIGAIANIILDPIFIFLFDLKVAGAAIATIISQALSAVWIFYFLLSKKSTIRIRFPRMRIQYPIVAKILSLGISPFVMYATESAIIIVFNFGLQRYGGDLYVGAMTIMNSVMQLMVVPLQGFTQGIQPIISYNYGARKFDRVKKTVLITVIVAFLFSSMGWLLSSIFPRIFASWFTTDMQLIGLVEKALPIFVGGMWLFGIQIACQTAFLGLGQSRISLFIALLRKVILLIPLALILPRFFGVMGIFWAEPVSDIISASTSGLVFLFSYKKILTEKVLDRIA
ncbi:MAG: MATE family efflux transporter [Sphaerochaetaceae bacterium]|nr:MATE family efflux transporter [Sphaerochaetaceae bacterium]MDD3671852.1 MATE family efflux transporter [Sphaerochaetaceae bacterium]MDD4841423.1 MATE family efflux transporter [Sphaerochaetaceae bacterium]MDX9933422.1 MATE family efflux transporter [Sphaerochaetaceae bacterium]NLO61486.1 MATE family efflux transporter [Spirochaetales bacterium]